MVQPQRGQREALPAQLVPQEEQVLVQEEQPLLQVLVLPRLFTQAPLYVLQEQVLVEAPATAVALVLFSVVQADCGKRGRL